MGPTNSKGNIMPLTNSTEQSVAESCRNVPLAESSRNQLLNDPLKLSPIQEKPLMNIHDEEEMIRAIAV